MAPLLLQMNWNKAMDEETSAFNKEKRQSYFVIVTIEGDNFCHLCTLAFRELTTELKSALTYKLLRGQTAFGSIRQLHHKKN